MQKIIKKQVKEQAKIQVSKILPKIEQTVNEQLEAEVLTSSSNLSKTFYAVATDLFEMELKKILFEKIEGNKSIHRSNEQRNLYKALVEAYKSNKIILDTYGDTVTLKRRRDDDDDKDEEPSAVSDREFKRCKEGKESESASAPKEKATRSAGKSIQPWISELAKQSDSRSSFNELMDNPVYFSNVLMNRLKVDTLTPELLAGPTYELMKGSCKSLVELEFFLEEVYKGTTDQLDWVNPEGQQYPHNLLKPLPLIPNNRGHRVIPFDHFINNDLEYLRGGASSRKYTTFVTKTKATDYEHIKSIVFQRRVEDLQLSVEIYQKKLNLTKPDTYCSDLNCKEAYIAYSNPRRFIYQNKDKQNTLMQIYELHKFSDGTLTDVRTALDVDDDQTDSYNDDDYFVHPKFSTHDEEAKDEESFDLIVQTPSHVENSNDECNDEASHGMNVRGGEGPNAEDDDNELYGDLNINLEGRDVQMTNVHTTQVLKDTHVTLTSVNPDGQQQSSSVSSQLVSNMLNPSLDTGIDSLYESTPRVDVPVTTTVEPLLLTAPTLPLPFIPIISQFAEAVSSIHGIVDRYLDHRMNEAVKLVVQLQSDKLRDEAQARNEDFLYKLDENIQKIIKEQVKEQVKIILDTYVDTVTLKRRRDDEDKDEEPSTGSDRGSKRRRVGKEPESTSAPKEKASKTSGKSIKGSESHQKTTSESAQAEEPMQTTHDLEEPVHLEFETGAADDQHVAEASQHPDWFPQQAKPPTPDRAWNTTLPATHGHIQPWISDLAKQADSRTSFNELMDTPVDFSAFLMNRLKEKGLIIAALRDELRKLKGKALVDNVVTTHIIAPEMLKIDMEPLASRLMNNRTTHSDYPWLTREEAAILREVVEQGKLQNPLNNYLDSAFWKPTGKVFTKTGYTWRPTETDTPKPVVTLVYLRKPRKSKTNVPVSKPKIIRHVSANNKEPNKSWGSIVFDVPSSSLDECRNDHMAKIMGYRDDQIMNVTISRLYYVERFRYNLFFVRQFCDSNLEVAFCQHTCFIRNLEGVDLLTGSRGNNLYTLSLGDMMASSSICLLSKASKTKSWLWHRRLSHLNFGALNHLARHSLVQGLP
nr:retrovirus-related Pol polyprotein from transposon TNT 1-94 [Tanacetum cinerariifolium]